MEFYVTVTVRVAVGWGQRYNALRDLFKNDNQLSVSVQEGILDVERKQVGVGEALVKELPTKLFRMILR